MIAPSKTSMTWSSRMRPLPNSSGMIVSVAPAALPMPSARWPALRPMATIRYQRPVVLRVDHQVLDQLDADVARRLEAERRDAVRQVQVVVDGLRHVHHLQATAGRAPRRASPNRPCRPRRS